MTVTLEEPGETPTASSPARYLGRLVVYAAVLWLVVGTLSWIVRPNAPARGMFAATAAWLILSFGVWHLTGLCPWPRRVRLRLLAIHALAALFFSAVLVLVDHFVQAATPNLRSGLRRLDDGGMWVGLWLYVLVAGLSYGQRLYDRLRTERQATLEAEAAVAAAQLDALRGQLNPHFLFNCLHSIAALVAESSPASAAIQRLGVLLRYALDGQAGDRVSLREEWDFTSNYLDMERLGLGEGLDDRVQLADEALGCLLPPFSIQLLAENAIRHGLSKRPGGGILEILAEVVGPRLVIRVENDLDSRPHDQPGIGVGLRNLRRRLAALYGDRARLETATLEGEKFRAILSIPLDRPNSQEVT